MAVLQLCLLTLFAVCANGSGMFSNTIFLDNNNYNVSYNFNESADTLEFLVEVRATGWVGFGFAVRAPNNMQNYDVAVGGVLNNGSGYLKDYFTNGFKAPPEDSQQDWMLTNSEEQNGVTTLKFYRARDTGDANDVAIERGASIFIIWAYHSSSDVGPGTFDKHTSKNSYAVTLIPAASTTVSTTTSASTPEMSRTMSTSTMVAMTTSTMEAMSTSTMPEIAPTTTTVTPSPASTSIVIPTPARPVHFPNFVSFNNGNYNASWMYNSSMDTLHFMVEVRATGWIGFGFATQAPNNMMGYDVAVGGVLSGSGYLQDYLTVGQMKPQLDTQQDWMRSYAKEENGVTTLRFYRKRNTSDQNDTAIQEGMPIFLIWAYHDTSDVQPSQFSKHSSKGSQQVTLIPAATPTPTPTSTPASTSIVTPTPARPMHFPDFVSFNNGNYNASWMYNNSMDTLHFMVEVRAAGWIGFGFATQAPNNMMGYDVAVGGVLSGSGYLQDYLTIGRMKPQLDTQQDWMRSYAREENGVTTLRFYRKRNTSDQNDTAIQEGMPIFLIWAYHSTSDVQPSQFATHSFKGSQQVTLIPAATPTPTPTPTPPMPQFTHAYDNNRFLLLWRYNDQTDKIFYHVKVKTTGWVGFGFALTAPNFMTNYDVIVGGFSNGQGYLHDYFTRGRMQPSPDANQDYKLLNASEVGGYTELMFERPRDTTDSNDLAFQPGGQVHIIWAYDDMDITNDRSFGIHSNKGWSANKVVMVPQQPITPTTPQFTHGYDNNRFLLLWRFNDQTDTMFYHLRVKTTGWVGFGFAETAPNNMINYDVIVGGFSNGQGYLYDYFTRGRTRPSPDANQDYKLLNASEVGGYTELMFERQRDTKDSNDLAFQPGGQVYIIFAYSDEDINNKDEFKIHTNRGWSSQTVVMVTGQPIPTEAAGTSLHSSIHGIVTFVIVLSYALLM